MAARRDSEPPAAHLALVCVCRVCGVPIDRREAQTGTRNCQRHKGAQGAAVPRIDGTTRFDDDLEAQAFVDAHPDGATLEEIGETLGRTRERVRQLETAALRKLLARLTLLGFTALDITSHFVGIAEERCSREPRGPYRRRVQVAPVVEVVIDPETIVHAHSLEVLGWYCDLEAAEEVGAIVVRASEVGDE